jgi:Cns1/TTC4 Wheel domain
LRNKKIKLGKRVHHLPEIVDVAITEDSDGKLHFPVLLLYDEYMATDFIQDWQEDTLLKDQLSLVFYEQAPWDE